MTRIEYIAKEYPRDTDGLLMPANTPEDKKIEKQLLSLRVKFRKNTQEMIEQLKTGLRWQSLDEVFERVLRTATSNAIECDINGVGYCRFWFHLEKFIKDSASIKKFELEYLVPAIQQRIAQLPEMWRSWFLNRLSLDLLDRFEQISRKGIIPPWYADPDTVMRLSLLSKGTFKAFEKETVIPFFEIKEEEIIRRELDGIALNKRSDAHRRAYLIYRDNPKMAKRFVARQVVDELYSTLDPKEKKRKIESIRKELEHKYPSRTKKIGKRNVERPEQVYSIPKSKRHGME